jgi:hypothetical protein
VVGAVDQHHLAPEAVDGLRHLHAHGAAAEDEHPAGHRLHGRDLAVGPHPVELAQTGDRRHERRRARGHHDVVGRVPRAVDLHGPDPGEAAGAAQHVDAVVGRPLGRARVGVVGDHEVPPGQGGPEVDVGGGCRVARGVHGFARAQQRLRRDARPVGALAPHELALDQGHPQPALGQRTGAVLARSTGAEHDDVVVVAGHCRARQSS